MGKESDPNQEKIRGALEEARRRFEKEQQFLLREGLNEQTMTTTLAEYIRREVSKIAEEYSVDCEYNRMTNGNQSNSKRVNDQLVKPDIIVHCRGVSGEKGGNILVIEAKKSTSSPENDKQKLRHYCRDLKYRYAALVIFEVGERRSGEEIASKKVRIDWLDPETEEFKTIRG